MGISPGAITLLGMNLRQVHRSGSVITFGVQKVQATHDEAVRRFTRGGIDPIHVASIPDGPIHQNALFRMLGYDTVESLDYFPTEGATHIYDLNRPLPRSLQGRFDLVYDGGTTEHCFSVAECLSNAVRLARNGGRIVHHLPLNNWVDHGFYQFSPGLFFDFYEANGFDELTMSLHFMNGRRESFLAYDPRRDGSLPYQLGGSARVLAFFSARKAGANDQLVFPIQGRYRRAFAEARNSNPAAQKPSRLARLRRSILKRTLRLRARRC